MFLQSYFLNLLVIRDVAMLIDMFKYKNIQKGDIYHCYNEQTAIQMYDMFNENNIRMNIKKINVDNNVIKINKYVKVGVIINASCNGWFNIFDVNNETAFKPAIIWLVMTENVMQTTEVLSRYKINVNSEVTVIFNRDEDYILYEAYNTGFNKNGKFIVREIGLWNESLCIEEKDRRNLEGLELRSTVVIPKIHRIVNETFVKYMEDQEPDLIKVDPVHRNKGFAAVRLFRDMLNVTYKFQRTNSWGYVVNGTFDGMVGAMQRGEVDIGGSPLFIRVDRMEHADYAALTWPTRLNFIFRHPKQQGSYFRIYTRPFASKVWYCVISIMVLSAVLLGVLLKLRSIRVSGDDRDVSFSLAVLLILSAMAQQGHIIQRSSNSLKMIMFTSTIFALTIYQYYGAVVVSTLLYEEPKNIKTLQDLLKSSLSAGVEDSLYNKDYFKNTKDPVAREIYLKKVVNTEPNRFYSVVDGVGLIQKEGFAFFVDSAVAYRRMRNTFSGKELCELQEIGVYSSYMGIVVARGSPYREVVTYSTRRLKEHGFITRLFTLWDEPKPPCVPQADSSLISVTIQDFATPLAVMALGFVAAGVIFCAEVVAARVGCQATPIAFTL